MAAPSLTIARLKALSLNHLQRQSYSASGKAMIQNLGVIKKSKHIQLKYLHPQELVEQGVITLHKVKLTPQS
eukprot:6469759-Amphidinium_carterae.2